MSLETENKVLEQGLQVLKVQDYAGESEENLNQHIYELENQVKDLEFNYNRHYDAYTTCGSTQSEYCLYSDGVF